MLHIGEMWREMEFQWENGVARAPVWHPLAPMRWRSRPWTPGALKNIPRRIQESVYREALRLEVVPHGVFCDGASERAVGGFVRIRRL
jgi:hypothetical protein